MSRGGFGLLFYFVDIVEDKKMVDFVKGKTTYPVGAGLVFPRGFNEKVVTPSGEVWLKTGCWKLISQSLMWTCGEDLH